MCGHIAPFSHRVDWALFWRGRKIDTTYFMFQNLGYYSWVCFWSVKLLRPKNTNSRSFVLWVKIWAVYIQFAWKLWNKYLINTPFDEQAIFFLFLFPSTKYLYEIEFFTENSSTVSLHSCWLPKRDFHRNERFFIVGYTACIPPIRATWFCMAILPEDEKEEKWGRYRE